MPLTQKLAAKGNPIKESSRNIHIGPFTNPEDIAWRTVQMKENNDPEEEFMIITFKKAQSLKPAKYLSQNRMKWSSELERVPTLDNLSKGSSLAQVGSSLSYTDTTHWYSSSSENPPSMFVRAFADEDHGHFSLSGSIGKLVGQQLQHGNVVRIVANGSYKSGGSPERNMSNQAFGTVVQDGSSEAVPLSIIDELQKKKAKILTPRSRSAYLPLPIVSDTYPVVLHASHQHKPFSSIGFHSVSPKGEVNQTPGQRRGRSRNFQSAIVRITQCLQEQRLGRGVKERMELHRYPQKFPETAPNMKCLGALKVNLHQLSAYGDIVKSAGMEKFPKQCHNPSPLTARTGPAYKRPLVPIIAPRQKSTSSDVGCVRNGVNPKHCPDITICSPDSLRGLLGAARMKTNSYQTPPLSHKSPNTNLEGKMGFLFISKPLDCNLNVTNPFVCKEFSCRKEETHTGWAKLPVRQLVGEDGVGLYGMSFRLSKVNSSAENRDLMETPVITGTPLHAPPASSVHPYDPEIHLGASDTKVLAKKCIASEAKGEGSKSEGFVKTVLPFEQHQAISIPTAKCM